METGMSHTIPGDDDGNPWWYAMEVCPLIGIRLQGHTLEALDDDERKYLTSIRANTTNTPGRPLVMTNGHNQGRSDDPMMLTQVERLARLVREYGDCLARACSLQRRILRLLADVDDAELADDTLGILAAQCASSYTVMADGRARAAGVFEEDEDDEDNEDTDNDETA